MQLPFPDRTKIYTVVVRHEDDPEMIMGLVDAMPEGTVCVLMLHSILPESHPNYGREPWNWSAVRFEQLCAGLREGSLTAGYKIGTLKEFTDYCH